MKNNIKKVFFFYTLIFSLIAVHIIKFVLFDSEAILTNSYNTRLSNTDMSIKRGSIISSDGIILAESVSDGNIYKRSYAYPEEFSHVIGFISNGKSGIESYYNFSLQKLDNEIWQRLKNVFSDSPLQGNSLRLTLNAALQRYVYEKLGTSKGAIVVSEPSTGKILAMVSYPNFNPLTISNEWNSLKNNTKDSPLLNRATQGLYPPGSIFKIITSDAIISNFPDYLSYQHKCTGKERLGDSLIHCFNSNAHGQTDLKNAMRSSCNTYFAKLGLKIGSQALCLSAKNALFNSNLDFPLEYKKSSFSLTASSSQDEIIQTSIGQGETLVTPLHMAMITSAIANSGLMMKPYIVDCVLNYNGSEIKKNMPQMQAQAFSAENANIISDMMEDVVASGTAIDAKIKNISVAGKTGTAETSNGKDHAWFVCFAPAENPQIAVSIILENGGTGSKAVPIARDIIKYYLRNP